VPRPSERTKAPAPAPSAPTRPMECARVWEDDYLEPCPRCGRPMVAIMGSRQAVCEHCGFRESCCF